jgi:lysophospholipase L1-like esterase
MRYLRYAVLSVLALAALALPPGPKGASGVTDGYPDSMASLGDSITRATNPEPFLLGDQPQYSWSTGDSSAVEGHYYRILQQNSLISGNNYNDAVSGARMTDLNGQAQSAVSQVVEYVTILIGANDVCTSSEATMTPVETYRSQFQQAMDTLTSGLPDARIFVASIPDIYGLWSILKDNPSALFMWNTFNICQSMLANPTSSAQADVERRDRVRQRNIDFNTQLGEVCGLYTNCLFDNNTGFNTQFEPIHMSTLDYFHPSIAGQALAASVTWDATYFGDPDGDGYANAIDNCPDWFNPGQGWPPWPVQPNDPDCDGFTDADEGDIGTDAADACPNTPDPNDEADDCWPPDWDDSQTVNLLDLLPFKPHFNATDPLDPKYDARYDLNTDDAINLLDVLVFKPFYSLSCLIQPVTVVIADLASRLGIGQEEVDVLVAMEVEWDSVCLGVEYPEIMCGSMVTPGYWVALEALAAEYIYHTDCSTQVIATDLAQAAGATIDPAPPPSSGACG